MWTTHTRQLTLREWFPGDDPIAVAVATLCILREDYFIDLMGLVKGGSRHAWKEITKEMGYPDLDENAPAWRRLYFFRNSLRTLREIRSIVDRLNSDSRWRAALKNESVLLQERFQTLRQVMDTVPDLIEDLRDKIGGHVLHSALKESLDHLNDDRKGFYQEGKIRGKAHYKFAYELILGMMLPDAKEKDLGEEIDALLTKTADLVYVWEAIDEVFVAYATGRQLDFI